MPGFSTSTLKSLSAVIAAAPPIGGSSDDTASIQAQLNQLSGTGGELWLRPDTYNLSAAPGSLVVPDNVCLRGQRYGPACTLGGTVLSLTGAEGNSTGQSIFLGNCSGLNGLTFYYPNQPTTNSTPIVYPPTVGMWLNNPSVTYNNQYVLNCCFYNPYYAVNCKAASRVLIENVFGSPIALGVNVDQSYDINRFRNVHWNPFYGLYTSNLSNWIQNNGIAFQFGRSDEQYCEGLFCFAYKTAYYFYDDGVVSPGTTYGSFTGCSGDTVINGIDVSSCRNVGINWHGGGFAAYGDPAYLISLAEGTLLVDGVRFWQGASINQTGGNLQIMNSWFLNGVAISASAGTLGLNGNQFNDAATTISMTGNARGTFMGNTGPSGHTFTSLLTTNTTSGTISTAGNN